MQVSQLLMNVMLAVFFALCQRLEVASQWLPPMLTMHNVASKNTSSKPTETLLTNGELDRLNTTDALTQSWRQQQRIPAYYGGDINWCTLCFLTLIVRRDGKLIWPEGDQAQYIRLNLLKYTLYCNATYDGFLCWPPTPAGETSHQHCPDIRLSDATKFAYRRCGANGFWVGRHLNDTTTAGWTNYTPCFPALVQNLFYKVYDDEGDAQLKFRTAQNTRYMEFVGYALSLNAILGSIYIFTAFKTLHNKRTVIHKNLLCAILLETIVRILLYTDQALFRDIDELNQNTRRGIENMPYVCEGVYVLLEYTRLVVYSWMLIEGIFLNTLVSANTLRNEIPTMYYIMSGWMMPIILTAIWVAFTANHYSGDKVKICWYGYNYLPSYYIVQGPILGIIAINIVFLGSIMHVIVNKLRRTNNSELLKIKKTVRAALILLPLLGIGNVFNMFDYPLDGSVTGFAIWCYATHFFRSFQGVFITLIYCYTNGEVIKVLKKKWGKYNCCARRSRQRRPDGRYSPRDRPIFHISNNDLNADIPMTTMRWQRPSSTTHHVNISDGESVPGPRNQVREVT